MSRRIIKQPNGKYCVFSSIVGNILDYNMTEKDIIEEWSNDELVTDSREQIESKVKDIISKLEKGEKPYHQFTMSYNEMLSTIQDVHGIHETVEVMKAVERKPQLS